MRQYLENESMFDQLKDPSFEKFYEYNTEAKWKDAICTDFEPKIERVNLGQSSESDNESDEDYVNPTILRRTRPKANTKYSFTNTKLSHPTDNHIHGQKDTMIVKYTVGDIRVNDKVDNTQSSKYTFYKNMITKPKRKYEKFRTFTYDHDFDENGLLYYLGSCAKKISYSNPAEEGLVIVTASPPVARKSAPITAVAGRKCETMCMTANDIDGPCWIMIDLKDVKIKLTHYTLKHHELNSNALRTWTLEACNDKHTERWIVLKCHQEDDSLNTSTSGATKTWKVRNGYGYFSKFQISMNGGNNSGHWNLACSGIEFYGKAFGGDILGLDIENNEEKKEMKDILNTDDEFKNVIATDTDFDPANWKWNVYSQIYEICLFDNGTIMERKKGVFNTSSSNTQFMFACSHGFCRGIVEYRIKYESESHECSRDLVGITSNIQDCASPNDKLITWVDDRWEYPCNRYIYWGGGKVYCIEKGDETLKPSQKCKLKWKSGQILTVKVDMTGDKWTIMFLIDSETIYNDEIEKAECYYPIISTQYDDVKYTITT